MPKYFAYVAIFFVICATSMNFNINNFSGRGGPPFSLFSDSTSKRNIINTEEEVNNNNNNDNIP